MGGGDLLNLLIERGVFYKKTLSVFISQRSAFSSFSPSVVAFLDYFYHVQMILRNFQHLVIHSFSQAFLARNIFNSVRRRGSPGSKTGEKRPTSAVPPVSP